MPTSPIDVAVTDGGVAVVVINRPEVHNALNETVIAELTIALIALGDNPRVRVVVLRGRGRSFSAGADLDWMRRLGQQSEAENLADAHTLARLMHTLDRLPKPTIAAVHGAALGGGAGLVACCDIAIASEAASFGLPEVRLGLIPAVISPYLVAAMGARACRRLILTGERFTAAEALRLGLVHAVVAPESLDGAVVEAAGRLCTGAPEAQAAAKALLFEVSRQSPDETVIQATAEAIARRRSSAEGREGVAAFLDKRQPAWVR